MEYILNQKIEEIDSIYRNTFFDRCFFTLRGTSIIRDCYFSNCVFQVELTNSEIQAVFINGNIQNSTFEKSNLDFKLLSTHTSGNKFLNSKIRLIGNPYIQSSEFEGDVTIIGGEITYSSFSGNIFLSNLFCHDVRFKEIPEMNNIVLSPQGKSLEITQGLAVLKEEGSIVGIATPVEIRASTPEVYYQLENYSKRWL